MLTIKTSPELSLSFNKPLVKRVPIKLKQVERDHLKIANWLSDRSFECASIIVHVDPLRESEDAEGMMEVTHRLIPSELRSLLRKKTKYPTDGEIDRMLEANHLPFRKYNHSKTREHQLDNYDFYHEVCEKFYEAHEMLAIPELYWELKTKFKETYCGNNFAEDFRKYFVTLALPRSAKSSKRIYPLPHPFEYNPLQSWNQWYFVNRGDRIEYVQTSDYKTSSGDHYKWATAFASVSASYKSVIPTYVFRLSDLNEFSFIKKYDTFKFMVDVTSDNYKRYFSGQEQLDQLVKTRGLVVRHGQVIDYDIATKV